MTADELFTPAHAACDWLAERALAPHLLIHPDLSEEFADCAKDGARALVLGDAGRFFDFEAMNAAFRALEGGADFLALAANRVFLDDDGKLSLDAGAFVAALRYASGVEPVLMGKPAPGFFCAAAASMALTLGDVAMIGDDAEADVAGALNAGAGAGVLVATGKYRPGDETRYEPQPTALAGDVAEAVEIFLGMNRQPGYPTLRAKSSDHHIVLPAL